jgi:hypothetical protein
MVRTSYEADRITYVKDIKLQGTVQEGKKVKFFFEGLHNARLLQKSQKKILVKTRIYQFMKKKRLAYLNINCIQAFLALLDIITYRIILTNTID